MDPILAELKEAAQQLFTEERDQIGTLLNKAKAEDLPVVTRTLRRLATIEVQKRIRPESAIELEQEQTMLLNTLAAMATRYGLDAVSELNRVLNKVYAFADRLLAALLDKAFAAVVL